MSRIDKYVEKKIIEYEGVVRGENEELLLMTLGFPFEVIKKFWNL
jgi:hypothetical protein